MKRKDFLVSLGLMGIAPSLLSKNAKFELVDNKKEIKSDVVKLTMYQFGDILDKDLVWIMKPDNINNDVTYIPVIEGYINSVSVLYGGIYKVEVIIVRQVNHLNTDDSLVLYHAKISDDGRTYHKRFAIERIEG